MLREKELIVALIIITISVSTTGAEEFEGFNTVWLTNITDYLFSFKPNEYSGVAIDERTGRVFVANSKGELVSVNSADGSIEWRYRLENAVVTRPVYLEGRVFVATSGGELYSIDVSSKRPSILWSRTLGSGIVSDITLDKERIFLITEKNTIFCINQKDGSIVYQITHQIPEGFSIFTNRPVILSDKKAIYAISTGELHIVQKEDGKLLNKLDIYSPDDRIDGFSGLEILDDSIYLSTSSGALYRIEIESSKIIWSRNAHPISDLKIDRETKRLISFFQNGEIATYDTDGRLLKRTKFIDREILGGDKIGSRIIIRYAKGILIMISAEDLSMISSISLGYSVMAPILYSGKFAYLFTSKGSLIKFFIK